MYVLGHLGFTALAWLALRRRAVLLPMLVGALLPDLVDKPLGLLLATGNGRLIAHTLLAVALLGLLAAWRRSPILGSVALGMAAHLVLDQMWLVPEVLLWPTLGVFPRGEWGLTAYVEHAFDPFILVTEAAGAAALAFVAWRIGPTRAAWEQVLFAPLRSRRVEAAPPRPADGHAAPAGRDAR